MPTSGTVRVIKDTHGAGLDALIKRLGRGEHRVLVGVPKGAGDEGGVSVAQVAAFVEFGASGPERPFLRGGVREALPQVSRVASRDLSDVARGTKTLDVALERAGAIGAGSVKRYMAGSTFAPNAPSTIAKKGSSQPTIDDAQLRQSITSVLEKNA
jgi:hypothetical protein